MNNVNRIVAPIPYFLKFKNKFKYKMICIMCLINFLIIKILADDEIKVEKNYDDFDIEIIKDFNNLLEDSRSFKSSEAIKPHLMHNVLKAQLQ